MEKAFQESSFLKLSEEAVILRIFAKPHAKKSQFLGVHEDALAIALKAKPHEGEANQALIKLLSESLGIPKTQISLEKGGQSRFKIIKIFQPEKNYLKIKTFLDSLPPLQ